MFYVGMSNVSHLVSVLVSQTLLSWFLIKKILRLVSIVFVHNEIMCAVLS